MGFFDWFRRTERPAVMTPLQSPWRRGTLGDVFCSDACYERAGRGMLASHGKSRDCCFCPAWVTYGQPGVAFMFFINEPNLVCPACHEKARTFNATRKECSICERLHP
jgi:hypothetical protein